MGWIFAMALSVLTLLGLWISRKCSRLVLEMAVAAVLVALAGYGWQGSPDMPGQPVGNGAGITSGPSGR